MALTDENPFLNNLREFKKNKNIAPVVDNNEADVFSDTVKKKVSSIGVALSPKSSGTTLSALQSNDPFNLSGPTAPQIYSREKQNEYVVSNKSYTPPKVKPQSLKEAIDDDDSYIGALWNQIPNAVGDFLRGASKLMGKAFATLPAIQQIETGFDIAKDITGSAITNPVRQILSTENLEQPGKLAEEAIGKLRTSSSSQFNEEDIQRGFDLTDGLSIKDAKALPIMLTRMAADAGLAIPTGGISFVAQGYNQGLKEYDAAVKDNPKLKNDNTRELFAVSYGTINGLADKVGLDFITKNPAASKAAKRYILKMGLQKLKEVGGELTTDVIEKTLAKVAGQTFSKLKTVGLKSVLGAGVEGATEAAQGGLSDGLKILTNKLSDADVFDPQQVNEGFWKNRINDLAAGTVMGGVLGTGMHGLKSSDKYIAERVAESTTPEELEFLKGELASQVEDGTLEPEQAEVLNSSIDKYSEANQKLPKGLSTDKRVKALQLITERDIIKQQKERIVEEVGNLDEAIIPQVGSAIDVLDNKEHQKNDEIRESASDETYKYFKSAEDGLWYKQLGSDKLQEISEAYYNLQTQDQGISPEFNSGQDSEPLVPETETGISAAENVEDPEVLQINNVSEPNPQIVTDNSQTARVSSEQVKPGESAFSSQVGDQALSVSKITPNKKIKANQKIASNEVSVSRGIKPSEGQIAFAAFKDIQSYDPFEHSYTESYPENSFIEEEKIPEKLKSSYQNLESKGLIVESDGKYFLTDDGKGYIDAVKARLETRKAIKDGIELFPRDAALSPEEVEQLSTRVTPDEIKATDIELDNDHELSTQDIINYERSRTTEQQSGDQVEPLQEAIQQSGNDRGSNVSEDTSGAAVEGEPKPGSSPTTGGTKSNLTTEPDFFEQVLDQSDVKPVLDFLDSLKIKSNTGLQSSILPVAELYNSAIEIIKSAVRTGNTLAKAIRLAKDYLSEQGVKGEQVRAFERSITSKMEVDNERLPTIKQIIRESTDRRSRSKVVMTELQALKKQMKDSYAGFKKGLKEGTNREKLNQSTLSTITAELRKKISDIISSAEKNNVFSGDVAGRTLANVIKKLAGTSDNPLKLLDVIDYVGKVAENTEYDSDLQSANRTRIQIKFQVNSKTNVKSATIKEVVKAFLRLKPSSVEAIKAYKEIANRILNNQRGVSIGKDGIVNESLEASNQEIIDYIDKQLAFQNKKAAEKLLENFQDLVDAGIIDKDSMSLAEMKEIINGIERADGTLDELLSNEKEQSYTRKRKALQRLLDSKFIELDDYMTKQRFPLADGTMENMLSSGQKSILESLKRVDTSELDLKQLAKMNDVINNIIQNDDFSGSGDMAILSEVQSSTRELSEKVKGSGIELGSIGNAFIQGFASTNLMPEFIFKSSKIAAEAQRLSGISDVFNGHARARIEQNNTMKGYMDLKKTLSSGLDKPENRYRRGIYARVIQHFGGSEAARTTEFNRLKELIRQTGEKLSASSEKDFPEELKEGKIVQQVYSELLEGSRSVSEVRTKLQKIAPDNIKLVEYWQKKFAGITDKMAESAEIYDNKAWEDVAEYTPTKMKAVSGGSLVDSKTDRDIFEAQFFSKKVDNSPATTKITRTKTTNLPKNAALDLDFDKVSSRKYYESLYDIETNKALTKVRAMLTEPKVAELFGGKKNLKVVQESIRSSVALQKGNVPVPDAFQRKLTEASNVLQAKGARIALGSVSQFLKQYPSVALDALGVLGTDLPLYFKAVGIGNNLPLFEKFNIGLRGTTRAGYSKEVDLNLIDGIKFDNDLNAALSTVADISKKVAEKSLKILEISDVAVARTSWLAFYMQDLKRQGIDIDKIDWKKEHEHPNNEAAAYAEQQVSRNQNANDGSSMGNFYKQSGNAYANVFKSIFLPFSTFSVNQRVRMTNDIQKLIYGGEKAEAARSLTATVIEQASFNYIKSYVIASITSAGANALLHAFGFDDVDIEKNKYKFQKFIANTFSDFFYSGMGSLPKVLLEKGSNSLYNLASDDKKTKLFYQFDPAKYGQPDLSSYGIYAVPFMKGYQAKQMLQYLDGETTKITKGGSETKHIETEVPMKENEIAFARVLFTIEALGLLGVSDADISQINSKATLQFQKYMGSEYGGSYNMKIYSQHLKLNKSDNNKK